jgi:hypothetical protein
MAPIKLTCSESVQQALSRLFEKYPAIDIAQEELNHFQVVSLLGMSRKRAVILLRETAAKMEETAND